MAMIGQFDNTNLVFGLLPRCRKYADNPASANTGSAVLYQGPSWPVGGVTSVYTNMASGYGMLGNIGAVNFDGSDDHVNLGKNIGNITTKFTLLMWITQRVIGTRDNFFYRFVDASNRFAFGSESSDQKLYINISNGSSSYGTFDYNTVVSANTMFLMAVVYDGTQSDNSGRLKLYLNNVQRALSFSGTIPATIPDLSAVDAMLSANVNALDGYIHGALLFNDAISIDRLTTLYALGPSLGGLRLYANGSLVDPSLERPIGAAVKIGDKNWSMPFRLRAEYSPSNETYVPLLLNLSLLSSSSYDNFWNNVASDGSDIRCVNATGTEIPIDLTGFVKTSKAGYISLRHPSISSGSDSGLLFLEWGGTSTRGVADTTTYQSCYGGSINYALAVKNGINKTGNRTITINSPVTQAAAKIGNGLSLNGSSGSANANHEVVGSGDITIRTWLKTLSSGESNGGRILDNGKLFIYCAGSLNNAFGFASDGATAVASAYYAYNANEQLHFTATRTSAGLATMYKNSELSGTANQNSGTPAAGTGNLYIGNRQADDRTFNGLIDELDIIGGILTANQIKLLFDVEETFEHNAAWDIGVPVKFKSVNGGGLRFGLGLGFKSN